MPAQPAVRAGRMSLANVTSEPDCGTQATVVHGPPGVGKTTLIADAPNVVFLCSEQGLKGAGKRQVPHFPYPARLSDVHDALDELLTGKHFFRHLAIDSIDWVETMIHAHVCAENGERHMEGLDYKKLYSAAMPYVDQLLKKLDVLRERRRMHVWLIAHSTQIKVANIKGETWDKWDLKLDRRFAERVREWADNVLFAGFVTDVVKGGRGTRAIGRMKGRLLYTVEAANHFAKNRNALPDTLPLDFDALRCALNAGRPAPDAELLARIEALLPLLSEDDQATIRANLEAYQPNNPRRFALILTKAESLYEIACAGREADALPSSEPDGSKRDSGVDDEDTDPGAGEARGPATAPVGASSAIADDADLEDNDPTWETLVRTALQRIDEAENRGRVDGVLREVGAVGFPKAQIDRVLEAAFDWRIDNAEEPAALEPLALEIRAVDFAEPARRRLLAKYTAKKLALAARVSEANTRA